MRTWRLWCAAALALTIGTGPSTTLPVVPARPAIAPSPPEPVAAATPPDLVPVANRDPAPKVLFVGDSLAAQLGHHATVALREAGVDSRVAAAWGLGLFTREQYDMGALRPDPPEGTLLRMASAAVAEFDPDVIAVYSNHNYWPPHPRDAAGEVLTWESPGFPGMARTLLTDLVTRLRAGGATVYLIAPIPLFPPDHLPEQTAIWDAYMTAREELGVEVLTPGDFMARPDGERVDELPDCTGRPRRVRPEDDVHLTYFGAGLLGGRAAQAVAGRLPRPAAPGSRTGTRPTGPGEAPVALVPTGAGYRLVSCDGATFHFGRHATPVGSAADDQGRPPGDPVVAATSTAAGARAALLLTRAGVVLRLDEPRSDGAPAATTAATVARVALRPDQRPVGIAAAGAPADSDPGDPARSHDPDDTALSRNPGDDDTSDPGDDRGDGGPGDGDPGSDSDPGDGDPGDGDPGDSDPGSGDGGGPGGPGEAGGFWVATSDGRVDAFAGAPRLGNLAPADGEEVVALAAAPGGDGYYLLTSAGRVAGFGAAAHHGDLQASPPATPPVALAVHPGGGYWILERSGTVHPFGAARDWGSAAAVDMWHQTFDRHTAGLPPLRLPAAEAPPVEAVALLPTASGRGYWLALASGAVCHFGDAPTLGGIHRAEVDPLMTYVGEPYYDDGPCTPPPRDRLLALSNLYAGIREVLAAR